MADDYYVASAGDSNQLLNESGEYDRTIKRSTRVLSKFNQEQRKTAFESIKSSMLVVAGAQLIYKGTTRILNKLQSSINKFTYAPLIEGLNEYTTQLTNFQAIVQNTSQWFDSGDSVGQIEAITGALDELNDYADKTIYKYSDMMNAVTGFTTAGLTIEDATSVAKGLASLTAYMGKGAQSYATAAYMFDQAMQYGKMQNYQWRFISQTAGIGGEMTKKLMIETAKAMGKDAPDWDELSNIYASLGGEEADNSFQESLRDDWLTAGVLLTSMQVLNGEFDDATLKAKGFSDEIIEMSHAAVESAGQVRTYGQFMDAVVESIGTGWSRIFKAIFGDVTVATKMWTNLMNTVTDDIKVATDLISDEAKIFSDLGGRNNIEKILGNIWKIIKNIGKSAYKVFGKMVPNGLGQSMYDISESLVRITDVLAGNIEPASGFERIMVGIGDAVSFLFGLAQRLAAVIVKLVKATKPIWDGVVNFVSRFGPQLGKLLENIVGFIETLGDKLAASGLFEAIGGLFTGASDAIDSGLAKGVSGFFITIFDSIGNAIKGIDVDGIFGALINLIKSFTGMFDESADNTKSVWSFIKFAAAIWLAVKMLKPVFKDIASIAKSYSGVGNQFWSIMGAVLAVLIAFEMFNQIKMGNILSLWVKMEFLAAAISLLARSITKVSNAAGDAWTLIPLLLFIGGIIAAAVYGLLQAQEAGYDLDQLIEVLKVISTILKSLALLIGSIALLLFAISLKQYIAAKYGKKAMALAQQNQDLIKKLLNRDTWNFNTKGTVNVNFLNTGVQFMLGIAASIASIGFAIKMIAEAIEITGELRPGDMKQGIGVVWAIVGILAILVAGIFVLSKFNKKGNKTTITSNISVSKVFAGKDTTKTVENSGFGWIIASVIVITAAIKILADEVVKLSEIKTPALWKGVGAIAVIGAIVGGLVTGLRFLSKVKTEGFRPDVILTLAFVLGAMVQLGLMAALLGLLPSEKLKQGIASVFILSLIIGGLVTGLQFLSKVKTEGFRPGVIVTLGVIIAGIVALGIEASLLGLVPLQILAKGGLAIVALGLILVGLTYLIQKVGKTTDPKSMLSFIVVAAGMTAILIAFAAVALALAALSSIPNVADASPAILAIAGTILILSGAVAILTNLAKSNLTNVLLATLAIIAIMASLSLVIDSISKINPNFKMSTILWIGVLVTWLAGIVAGLAVLIGGTAGIGAAALLAAVAVILALAGAIALVMDALNKAADPLEAMVDLFELINEINMGKFLANLAVFVDALKKAIPTFASFSAAMGTFSGALLFSAGDMNITTQSITSGTVIPSSGTGGTTEIDTNTATVEAQQGSEIKQETSAEETLTPKQRAGNRLRQWIFNNPALMKPNVAMIGVNPGVTGVGSSAVSDYADDYTLNDIGKMIENLTGQFESYMEIDASSLYTNQYYDVLSDAKMTKGTTVNDALETANELLEEVRNGLIPAVKGTIEDELINRWNAMGIYLDKEKVGVFTDMKFGDMYNE